MIDFEVLIQRIREARLIDSFDPERDVIDIIREFEKEFEQKECLK